MQFMVRQNWRNFEGNFLHLRQKVVVELEKVLMLQKVVMQELV